jgi:hypothetical protein
VSDCIAGAHAALLAEEAGPLGTITGADAAGGGADAQKTELEGQRDAAAAAVARSEQLAASLEGSAGAAGDMATARDTLQKEEELVKLKRACCCGKKPPACLG